MLQQKHYKPTISECFKNLKFVVANHVSDYKEKERKEEKVTNVNFNDFAFLVSSCTMLSEILQEGCFSKIGNSSLQIIHHMKASHFCLASVTVLSLIKFSV
jgi:hypothetical protein